MDRCLCWLLAPSLTSVVEQISLDRPDLAPRTQHDTGRGGCDRAGARRQALGALAPIVSNRAAGGRVEPAPHARRTAVMRQPARPFDSPLVVMDTACIRARA